MPMRRNRPQIVRIKLVEQRLGDFGKFVVELVVNPAGTGVRRLRSAARREGLRTPRRRACRRPATFGYFSLNSAAIWRMNVNSRS